LLIVLTLVGVLIIKGASYLDVVSWLKGLGKGCVPIATSFSYCNITTRSDLITTLGLNRNKLVFS
jgi:hypothetical protein